MNATQSLRQAGWRLRVADSNQAELLSLSAPPDGMRVAIGHCGTEAVWDIQLNLPRLNLIAGTEYRVHFEARADAPREVAVGVAMAHEPWSGLGLYQKVQLTEEWQRHELAFVAAAEDRNARIHFDLGGSGIAVELAHIGMLLQDGSPAPVAVEFGSLRRSTPISPKWGFDRGMPIDRYYIGKFLDEHSADIHGRVLEIEDNFYTLHFGGTRVTEGDILDVKKENSKATIIADLTDAPQLADERFDCIILTQTLQFIYDVRAAIRTLYRILKPGGVLLATFSGISQTDDTTADTSLYWNFTPRSARQLFGEVFAPSEVKVETFGNVLAASSFLYGISAEELTTEELDYAGRGYEVTIGVRAVKSKSGGEFPTLAKRSTSTSGPDGQAVILMYHRIAEGDADPFSLSVSPEHFAQHLAAIRKHACPRSLRELSDSVRAGSISDRSVAITFDDGYVDNLQYGKPLLAEHGIPATVFIATGNTGQQREFWWDELERVFLQPGTLPSDLVLNLQGRTHQWNLGKWARYGRGESLQYRPWQYTDDPPTTRHSLYLMVWQLLQPIPEYDRCQALADLAAWSGYTTHRPSHRALDPEEVTTLAAGSLIEVGAHSVSHPMLAGLPGDLQRREMEQSKSRLEQILGMPVTSFAYPYGSASSETVRIAASSGFERACSTVAGAVQRGADCFRLPRVQVGNWTGEEFTNRLASWFRKSADLREEASR